MSSIVSAKTRFLALKPEPALDRLIRDYKARAHALAGPQLYLEDPPHLTVFLAAFPSGVCLLDRVRDQVRAQPSPSLRLHGWQTFENDALTGQNTLTCAIHPADKESLRCYQSTLIAALAPLRDAQATLDRLKQRWGFFNAEQMAASEAHGFPYVGPGWEPHLTIASIDSAHWSVVVAPLAAPPPAGEFRWASLQEFELNGVHPTLLGNLDFPGSESTDQIF